MNKRNQLNLGLLVFIIIAASLVYFDPTQKTETQQDISVLTQNDINDITIKRLGKENIVLQKKHKVWRLIKPYNTDINQFRLDTLLRLVDTIPQSSYPLENVQRYGLDKPKIEVLFNKNSNSALSIKFGASEPIRSRRYISAGNRLFLTNDTYFYALNSVATDYISPKILPNDFKIKGLELPGLTLEIKDERWQATPEPENFSIDSVNDLITEWKNAQAISIDTLTKNINTISTTQIKLFSKDASTITYHLLNNSDDFILIDQLKGLQYKLPLEKKELLLNLIDNNSEPSN